MVKQIIFGIASFLLLTPTFVFAEENTPPPAFDIASFPPEIQSILKKDPKLQTDKERQKVLDTVGAGSTPSLIQPAVTAPENTVNCFDYYHFNSVQVDIEPSVGNTVPGVPITFIGKVKNDNLYPIVAGSVYAKVFKKGGDESLTHQNGYALVDQFFAKEGISLPANSEQDISFEWQAPRFLESGEYEIGLFFTTANRFNLLGLSFTDDVVGNRAEFSVQSDVSGGISFDKNAVTLNDNQYRFAAFPPHFKKDETVQAKITLVNTTKTDQAIPISWTQYDWDSLRKENMVAEKKEIVLVKAGEKKTLSYESTQYTGAVTYLVAEAQYKDTHSILDIRFVRDGIDQIRMNFPALTSFPLKAGEETTVFACAHSTNQPIVPNSELTLSLKDTKGNVIHTYTYTGGITGDMMGVRDTFTPTESLDHLTLSTVLKKDGKVVEALDLKYNCEDIDPALCNTKSTAFSMDDVDSYTSTIKFLVIALSILALLLLGFFLVRRVREEHGV